MFKSLFRLMILYDNYEIWNQAFYLLGAKGSPKVEPFPFSKEEFFVKGLTFCLHDGRTFSAFTHWVHLFGKELNPVEVEKVLKQSEYNKALLGYYLDLINSESFSFLYVYVKKNDEMVILHKVKQPDELLLKWNIYSRPLTETPEKYLVLHNKKRIF